MLRTINRLIEPTSGRIVIDEIAADTLDAVTLRRSIGYVIQAVGLFAHLTVAQNIAVVPDLLHWSHERTAARVDELLQLVHLNPQVFAARYPARLSGGEAQRVGVARALAAHPRLLLMDEPFGALDAIVRLSLQDEMQRLVRKLGTTTLFVTHDVDEALRIADRLVIMRGGNIIQTATPLHALVAPADGFVRNLLRADDLLRRLDLIRVRDASDSHPPATDAQPISPDATLHEALNLLLSGARELAVIYAERPSERLNLARIVAACAAPLS